jgi:hypothetical protein
MGSPRFQELMARTDAIVQGAFALENKRTQDEKTFFRVHGFWPEKADATRRTESCFTTHGLKTTIILERVVTLV